MSKKTIKTKRVNKYEYTYVLQGLYPYSNGKYEDLTASVSRKEVMVDLKAYRINDDHGGVFRVIFRRTLNKKLNY